MRLFFIWIVLLFSPIQSWKLIPKRTVVRADIHAAKSSCPANLQRSVSATENNSQRYKVALDILDCLTSPKDDSDPQYDAEKDLRRDSLLLSNDYSQLKTILRKKGLRTSGDKQEMITRLLLHEIDPSIKFDEMSGLGVPLKYIDETDLASEKVRIRSAEERARDSVNNVDPDAEDMGVLRSRPAGLGLADEWQPLRRMVMDGLHRKEVTFDPVRVRRTEEQARREDYCTPPHTGAASLSAAPASSAAGVERRENHAYVVTMKGSVLGGGGGGKGIVLLPDGPDFDWRSKAVRVLAYELAFATGSVVVVPDLHRDTGSVGSEAAVANPLRPSLALLDAATVFDDVVAAMQYVQSERGVRVVTLAGVGAGAGLALELACDLHDLGRLAQFQEFSEMEGAHRRGSRGAASASVGVVSAEGILSLDVEVEVERRLVAAEMTALEGVVDSESPSGSSLLARLEKLCDADKEVFLDVVAAAGEDPGEEEDMGGADEVVISPETITGSDEQTAGDEGTVTMPNVMDLLEERGRVDRAEKAVLRVRRLRREWSRIVPAAARARDRRVLAPHTTLSLQELKACVPRAVLALQPDSFDAHRVGQAMCCATFVVAAEAVVATGRQDDVAVLHAQLAARRHEVTDFCVRRYGGTGDRFVLDPRCDHDARCAQEALAMGVYWLDAFSCSVEDGLSDGLGTTKDGDGAYAVVGEAQMTNPARPSAVAAYLHDEESMYEYGLDTDKDERGPKAAQH